MTIGFKFIDPVNWPNGVDLDDIYVRREYFNQGIIYKFKYTSTTPVGSIPGTNWKNLIDSSSLYYGLGVIRSDGALLLSGANDQGQIGDNTTGFRSNLVQTVSGGTNWKQVSTDGYTTGAIKTDGTLWLWGYNVTGALGDGTTINKSSPVQTIAGGTNWKQVYVGNSFVAAIKTDGTLWAWGINDSGQLGDNTIVNKSSPVQTVAGGTDWKQVSCGYTHMAATKTDGSLWVWGRNNVGQLGDGTNTYRSSPIQTISAGNNWKSVSAGFEGTGAIKTDGTLWVWGFNYNGQLGDGTFVYKSSPIQTVAGGSNWKQISMAKNPTAIKTDGTLWVWGPDPDSTAFPRYNPATSPVQVGNSLAPWKSTTVSGGFSYAIRLT